MSLRLEERLAKRKKMGNMRELCARDSLIDFSSNDYLGLARSTKLATSVREEWGKCPAPFNGLGSTGSRLLTGNSLYAQYLEDRIAAFHGFPEALLFNCGYMANVGLLAAVATQGDTIFFDTGVHASTHDGIRLSRANAFPFRHNDLEHLQSRLQTVSSQGERWICIESIYSTDGSCAPLVDICRLAKEYEAHVIVDEAHAVGVCGPDGRGLVAQQGLMPEVFAQISTFGKALGVQGAAVLGSAVLKRALINFATSYIYTTALPYHMLAAIKCSYDLLPHLEKERETLRRHIQTFCSLFSCTSSTQIQFVPVPGNGAAREIAKLLTDQGFDVRPLMSPTVQKGREGLRICLHAFNTEEELLALMKQFVLCTESS